MNFFLALEIFAATLALLCVALVPVAIGRDPGLRQRIVRVDGVPAARRPALPTRVGVAWVRAAFAPPIGACYYVLAGSFD